MKKLLFLIFLVSQLALGRDIFIGDRINLLISGSSEDKIREAFHSFEIEKITEEEDGIKVVLRAYKPGEQVVEIGDRSLVLNIRSSLQGEEKDIYPDLSDNSGRLLSRGPFPWLFVSGVLLGIGALISLLWGFIGRRKKDMKQLNPRERFYTGLGSLGKDYIYDISYLTREYADHLMGSNLLSGRYEREAEVPREFIHFLREMDSLKFARKSQGNREELTAKAKKLIEEIELTQSHTNIKEESNA